MLLVAASIDCGVELAMICMCGEDCIRYHVYTDAGRAYFLLSCWRAGGDIS